jgi:Domain of unknown function (DUF4384)
MKTNKTLAILGAFALSLCLTSAAFADDKTTSEPSPEDLKNSKERGLFIEPPVSPSINAIKGAPKAAGEKKPVKKELTKKAQPQASTHSTKTQPTAKVEVKTQAETASTTTKTKVAKLKIHRPMIARSKHNGSAVVAKSHVQIVAPTAKKDSGVETVSFEHDTIIKAWLNKPGEDPKYRDGEKMEINVTAGQDCNIAIFDYDGKGKLTQLFPNEYQTSGSLKSGETITVGGANSSFEYQVSTGPGERKVSERIFVFAYPTASETPISIAMNPVKDSPFRSADMTMEQYRRLVNESKVYFSREVKIVAKADSSVKQVAHNTTAAAPNKVELSFEIEK